MAPESEALVAYFVDSPDESGDSFLVKLERQLAAAPGASIQLAAELLIIYFHPMNASSMLQKNKLLQLVSTAGWREEFAGVPENLHGALYSGVASVDTGYNTFRWRIFPYSYPVATGHGHRPTTAS